jgi:hypothetical protein
MQKEAAMDVVGRSVIEMTETNFEHYKDEIIKLWFCGTGKEKCDFIRKNVLKIRNCYDSKISCVDCSEKNKKWIDQPYEETVIEIDWSKVPVDTPVFVNNFDNSVEFRRHLKEYKDDGDCKFICYDDGRSSFTTTDSVNAVSYWFNCRLAREEDIEKYRKK